LFQAVEGFTEFTNMGGKLRMSESRWLGHEDFLMESPMKECIVHIKLPYGPVVRERARDRMTRMVTGLATGLKVSK
jgi:hypothetical protein